VHDVVGGEVERSPAAAQQLTDEQKREQRLLALNMFQSLNTGWTPNLELWEVRSKVPCVALLLCVCSVRVAVLARWSTWHAPVSGLRVSYSSPECQFLGRSLAIAPCSDPLPACLVVQIAASTRS
jgi:hypothetical protein